MPGRYQGRSPLTVEPGRMDVSDGALIARYRNGDVQAFAELFERYRSPLFGFLVGRVGSADEANECFQEVWFRALRRIDRYREENFLAWLTQIARNLVIDRWRTRRPTVSLDEADPEGGTALGERIADPAPGPAERTTRTERLRRMTEAIAALPVEQREVVLMRVRQELPFREIARIQGVSINTALARMHYGLAKLRRALAEEEGNP